MARNDEYHHIVLPRLTVESARRGIICPAGLDNTDFITLLDDVVLTKATIAEIVEIYEHRVHVGMNWAKLNRGKKVVRIFPENPEDY